MKRIAELKRHLAEKLSARGRSVANESHTKCTMAVKGKLTEQVNQLSLCVTELKSEVINGKETGAELKFRLKAPEKRAEDVTYERDGLQASL